MEIIIVGPPSERFTRLDCAHFHKIFEFLGLKLCTMQLRVSAPSGGWGGGVGVLNLSLGRGRGVHQDSETKSPCLEEKFLDIHTL